MISAYVNCLKIPELRQRILFTLGIVALCRLAGNIPIPGVNPGELARLFDLIDRQGAGGGLLNMFNLFSGGALQKFAIAALGIMPYISASIVVQLMTPVLPQMEKLMREGESGRQKLNQYTRYLTLLICVIQGGMLIKTMTSPGALSQLFGIQEAIQLVDNPGPAFFLMTTLILTAGTMFIMWLGEQITERGIGNGASLIITVGIVDRLPSALVNMITLVRTGSVSDGGQNFTLVHLAVMLVMFFACCAATVAITQGMRKIPVKYAKATMARHGVSGQSSYMPLRVNFAGVMPLIFGSAVLMIPPWVFRALGNTEWGRKWGWLGELAGYFDPSHYWYLIIFGATIILFSFFWVANQFNPIQIADDLQKHGAFVPGIRPGQPTAEFLDQSMTRVTFAGAIFLTALAVLPMIISNQFSIPYSISAFFGGTSLLIMVGVMLDTMRQMEAHLLSYHYDGFLSKGKLRSRHG
ncbi:MAG: preprotein translocase subunit SecY [Lentisphaeria bacterium]|jgi:preprotein translocase subunit SecY